MIFIDDFAIDAAIKEVHNRKAKATTHPIEKGADATDHVIRNPPDIMLDCIVTNAPSGSMVNIRARESGVPSENAFAKMEDIYNTAKVVTVVTTLKTYVDMVCVDIQYNQDIKTGDALRFQATFQNLNFIENQRAFVKVASPSASKNNNRGNKPAKKPPDTPADKKADENSSLLWKLTH